jgi:hypothetical protein
VFLHGGVILSLKAANDAVVHSMCFLESVSVACFPPFWAKPRYEGMNCGKGSGKDTGALQYNSYNDD